MIHKMYLIDSEHFNAESAENLAVECTILHDHGLEHCSYTKQLFKVHCIDSWLRKSKSNTVLCQLEELTIDNSQMSQLMSQFPPLPFFPNQLSQGYSQGVSQTFPEGYSQQTSNPPMTNNDNPFSRMGFGHTPKC